MAKLKLTRTEKALAVLLIGIVIFVAGSIATRPFATIVNPSSVTVNWYDTTTNSKIDVSTRPLVATHNYAVGLVFTPQTFSATGTTYIVGKVELQICNKTTGVLVSSPAQSVYEFTRSLTIGGKLPDYTSDSYTGELSRINTHDIPAGEYTVKIYAYYYRLVWSYDPPVYWQNPSDANPVYVTECEVTINKDTTLTEDIIKTMTWTWKRADGTVIPNIATATVSGTITCNLELNQTVFTSIAGDTYTFSSVWVELHKQSSSGAYSEEVAKKFTGTGSGKNWVISLDTTTVPNGNYKFILIVEWTQSTGGSKLLPLSTWYSSMNGGMSPITDPTMIMVVGIVLIVGIGSVILLRKRKR